MTRDRLWKRAEALQRAGRFGSALKVYAQAARRAKRDDDAPRRLEAWLAAIECFRSLGRFREARPLAKNAVAWSLAEFPDKRAEAMAAFGLVERGLERYGDARPWLEAARADYRSRRDRAGEAYCWWGLGGCARFEGRVQEAIRAFRAARDRFQAVGDRSGEVYARYGLAGALRVTGAVQASLEEYREGWRRARRAHDRFGVAYGYCGMAHALRRLGRGREAERMYRASNRLYRAIGDRSSVGYTWWGLGVLALSSDQARTYFRNARREFQVAHDTRGEALARLGQVRRDGGSEKAALAWARRRGVSAGVLEAY